MNKKIRILSFCACALLPSLAPAQSFGDMIRNAATQAAARVVTSKTEETVTKALTTSPTAAPAPAPAPAPTAVNAESPSAAASAMPSPAPATAAAAAPVANANCPKTRAKPLPPIGPRPESYAPASLWPDESACPIYKFGDLKFEAATAQKRAFTEASKVSCNDCEGGYSYDAWAQQSLVKGGGDIGNKFRDMLIALNVGETLNWKGAKYAGTIKATGMHPIGETPCRQYRWTLKDKNQRVVAERDGLFCELLGDYASAAKYREVL